MLRSVQRAWSSGGLGLKRRCGSSFLPNLSTDVKPVLTSLYKSNVVSGLLSFDEKQYKLVKLLEKLQTLIEREHTTELASTIPPTNNSVPKTPGESAIDTETTKETTMVHEEPTKQRLRGLYMYGEVGTGKTMLMDLFFQNVNIPHKRRVHFSEFMLEVHNRVHRHKQNLLKQFGRDIQLNLSSERDSITIVARDIAREARVLCFDEFQVTDICDAMILTRLFDELWRQNVVLVATSNRPPTDLYLNGLNRQYFLPFIDRLQVHCVVRDINIADKDYRQGGQTAPNAYFIGNTPAHVEKLHGLYLSDLAERGHDKCGEVVIPVMNNRQLTLKQANLTAGVCYVDFAALCETEKGASDYQSLCSHFHTIYMPHIPVLSVLAHNEARRLITLIDAMYNANVRFVWVADAPPAELFEILTREEVERGAEGAGLGTDHSWSTAGTSSNYISESTTGRHSAVQHDMDKISSTGSVDSGSSGSVQKQHLRGQEQARMPLDSSMYFGTAIKFKSTATSTTTTTPTAITTTATTTTTTITDTTTTTTTTSYTSNSTTNTTPNTTTTLTNSTPTNTNITNISNTTTDNVDAAQDEMKVLEGELASVQELSFAFRRAASRLTEMSSVGYLQERWRKS